MRSPGGWLGTWCCTLSDCGRQKFQFYCCILFSSLRQIHCMIHGSNQRILDPNKRMSTARLMKPRRGLIAEIGTLILKILVEAERVNSQWCVSSPLELFPARWFYWRRWGQEEFAVGGWKYIVLGRVKPQLNPSSMDLCLLPDLECCI